MASLSPNPRHRFLGFDRIGYRLRSVHRACALRLKMPRNSGLTRKTREKHRELPPGKIVDFTLKIDPVFAAKVRLDDSPRLDHIEV